VNWGDPNLDLVIYRKSEAIHFKRTLLVPLPMQDLCKMEIVSSILCMLLIFSGIDAVHMNLNPKFIVSIRDRIDGLRLVAALREGDKETSMNLIQSNVTDLTRKDNVGFSAIHYAAQAGYNDIIMALLAREPDINDPTNCGETPLILAAEYNKMETVQLLIKNGADVMTLGFMNLTALASAVNYENIDIAMFISLYKLPEYPLDPKSTLKSLCFSDAMDEKNHNFIKKYQEVEGDFLIFHGLYAAEINAQTSSQAVRAKKMDIVNRFMLITGDENFKKYCLEQHEHACRAIILESTSKFDKLTASLVFEYHDSFDYKKISIEFKEKCLDAFNKHAGV